MCITYILEYIVWYICLVYLLVYLNNIMVESGQKSLGVVIKQIVVTDYDLLYKYDPMFDFLVTLDIFGSCCFETYKFEHASHQRASSKYVSGKVLRANRSH